MRSTSPQQRRQRGVSLVEALVAAGLLGITVAVGLTAWDTAVLGAHEATQVVWARCLARAEMEAVLQAPYSDSGQYPHPADVTVQASDGNDPQQVTVLVGPPGGGPAVYRLVALKSRALGGGSTFVAQDIVDGCPPS